MPQVISKYEEVLDSRDYIKEFIHVIQEAGFTKESFKGVVIQLRQAAQTCYRLNIQGEILKYTIKLVKMLTDTAMGGYKIVKETVILFVNILLKTVQFLAQTYIGQAVLFIIPTMSTLMAGFICGLYFATYIAIDLITNISFSKLKEWILQDEKTKKWFDYVFGTVGRSIEF